MARLGARNRTGNLPRPAGGDQAPAEWSPGSRPGPCPVAGQVKPRLSGPERSRDAPIADDAGARTAAARQTAEVSGVQRTPADLRAADSVLAAVPRPAVLVPDIAALGPDVAAEMAGTGWTPSSPAPTTARLPAVAPYIARTGWTPVVLAPTDLALAAAVARPAVLVPDIATAQTERAPIGPAATDSSPSMPVAATEVNTATLTATVPDPTAGPARAELPRSNIATTALAAPRATHIVTTTPLNAPLPAIPTTESDRAAVGWPGDCEVGYGGALRLVPGFMFFVFSGPDSTATHQADRRGDVRPAAVGWPRVDSVNPTVGTRDDPPPPAGPRASPDGVRASGCGADPFQSGRDKTVHEYGRGLDGPGNWNGVSRETNPFAGPDPLAGAGVGFDSGEQGVPHPRLDNGFGPEASSGQVYGTPIPTGEPSLPAEPRMPAPAPRVGPPGSTSGDVSAVRPVSGSAPVPSAPVSGSGAPPVSVAPEVVPAADEHVSRETPGRDEDDPPLAMEALRAVQILNPSGEITMPRPDHPRVLCVANQKGGVGKTTTTVNLAVALALHGNRVLVVDLDPQGNASTGLNVPHHAGIPDVYDCLIDNVPLSEVAQAVEGIPNLYCVPATIDLAGAEIELVSVVARESRLARAIGAHPETFDYIFIDCPPSLGLLTVNALCAAQEVLIPIQCEYYALEGLNQLINNINLVRQHLNPTLDVSTILLTMYDRRTRLADAVEQDVRNHFGEKVLEAVIPRNVRVSEAPSYGQSVMTYDPGSRGATSYFEAALEIANRGVSNGGTA
jgi:chromosome partitioning protein